MLGQVKALQWALAVGCEVSPAVVGSAVGSASTASAARRRSPHFKRSARMNLLRVTRSVRKNAKAVKKSVVQPLPYSFAPLRRDLRPLAGTVYSSIRTPTNAQTLSMAAWSWSPTVRSPIRDFSRKWLNTRAVVRAQSPWCLAICGGCMHRLRLWGCQDGYLGTSNSYC